MNARDEILGHGNSAEGSSGSVQCGDLSPDQNSGTSMAIDNRGEDDRKAPLAEDSTAMTINFLRARLLSERSVSKAARQKAQQLAKKVMELERQLEIVVEERKRAEKATQEALATLEHGGMVDYSKALESHTIQDGAAFESKDIFGTNEGTCFGPNSAEEEEEASTIHLLGNRGSEEQMLNSKFDMDETNRHHSHHMHRGLSWQTRGKSCVQIGKNAKKSPKQTLEQTHLDHVGVSDTESSSQRRIGKSCRQIKRKETRSVPEEELRVLSACSEDETRGPTYSTPEEISHSGQKEWDFCSKIFEDTLEDDFEGSCYTGDEKAIRSSSSNEAAEEGDELDARSDHVGGQTSGEECTERVHPECMVSYPAEDQNRQIDSGSDKEMEMERVLEQQAELIDQYEAEENAQKEWEEKFRELNSASDQSMDCQIDEKQEEEAEESNERTVVYFSSSKNSAATVNHERKEETWMSDQSTSGNFSIQTIEKSVLSEAVETMNGKSLEGTENETIQDMHQTMSASFCTMACRSPVESATCNESPVEGLGNQSNNFVQAIPIENALEYRHTENHKNRIEQEEQEGTLPSRILNSVNRKDCSNSLVPSTIQVVKSSNNVKNVPEHYCKDVGLNLTEQPGPILEKHISGTIQENTILTPLTHGAYEKVVDAMHGGEIADASSIRLPAKDEIGRVPDGVQAGIKMENIGQAIQSSELGKHMIGSKTGTRGYENSSGGSPMLRAGGKLHGSEALYHVSHGSVLRNPVEIMSDSVPREAQGALKGWYGGNNDEQGIPMMQGIHHKQPLAGITCDSMYPRVSDNPLRYMSDSVAKAGQGALKSWHSSYNNEQEVCMMQGIHQKHLVADTCNDMHPGVTGKPLKYMPSFAIERMQIQRRKETEENFIATDFQSSGGASHANMGTRPHQTNLEGMPFSSQPDGSTCLSESKMTSMGEVKPITATQRGGCFQTSWHGASTSEHSIVGSSCVANQFPENMISRLPYQDSYYHFTMNRIDPAFGSHENYVPARDSDQYLQRTLQRNGHEFQKSIGVLDTNHCSAKYKFPISSQGHSMSISGDQWAMSTAGNADVSRRRDFQPLFSQVGENNTGKKSHLSHMNQDRLHGHAQALQPLLHHQNDRFRDVLQALSLAKSQIQNTMHMTKPVSQRLNQAASFMQEHDTEKMARSCNPLETPLNCAELFRLPSEVDHRSSSQIQASRPSLADCGHSILMGIPNSLSSSVNRRDRASLHIQYNENAEILSRRQSLSADNQSAQVKKSDAYSLFHNEKVQSPQ